MAVNYTAPNSIEVRPSSIQISDNAGLNTSLSGFSNVLIQHATSMVDAEIGEGYTGLERQAMIMVEALHLTSGMDLAAILTRGALIAQIEQDGLISVHPDGFTDVQNMAARQGIGSGEYSDIRGLCQTIFPYIENEMGMSISAIWASTGKSIFREMRPALQAMITGQAPEHASVRTSVETLLNSAATSLFAEGTLTPEIQPGEDTMLRDHVIRDRAIRDLLTLGQSAPSREVRATLRPTRTPDIMGVIMAPFDGQSLIGEGYILMKINGQDQLDMYRRLIGSHVVTSTLNSASPDNGERGPRHYISMFRRLFGE